MYWGKKYVLSFTAKCLKSNITRARILINNPNGISGYHYFMEIREHIEIDQDWKEYEIEFTSKYRYNNNKNEGLPISSMGNTISITVLNSIDGIDFVIDNIKLVAKDHTMEFDYLEANNIKAHIDPIAPFMGLGFSQGSNHFQLEAPKGSGKSTIFTSNLWLGGLDQQDHLYVAAHKYGMYGRDFFLGPITNDYTMIDEQKEFSDAYIQKYYHTWKVTKAEIEYHKAHYADAGYVMPREIANWPAHGRTQHGEGWNLAPYKDVDGNGWYTPWSGDYPEIRGDEAVYFITNDAMGAHTESGSSREFGLEILGMAYAYNSSDEALQNTIFLSYVLQNKSTNDYKDFYFGFWSDFDIGYYGDDYIGCDTLLNLMYGYNGKEIDGNGEAWAYGANPPAQGAMFLNQKMSAFMFDMPSPVGAPYTAMGYYNMLQAKWWSGGHSLTLWGNGYGGSTQTKFMYSGDPVTQTGWTELTPNGPSSTPNTPDDRKGVMSAGPFTLPAGKSLCIDIALPFARSFEGNHINSVTLLKQYAQTIQQFYNNQNFEHNCSNIIGIKENTIYNDKLLIYPNPSNGQFTVTCEKIIESIELYDMLGRKVFADAPKVQTTQINANLSKGLYIYRVVLQDHSVRSGKIVVQ
ncbi:MAG: T9SS type A sorting domain-containing protein [Bacteroidetes bacterium]|nr:T9SS type A sorting domain-containing protein [Bacteroidota bacterium]MCL2303170.1 T9SS type A sorting domain-containing protein [Lentimicrobiaceae bacterium]